MCQEKPLWMRRCSKNADLLERARWCNPFSSTVMLELLIFSAIRLNLSVIYCACSLPRVSHDAFFICNKTYTYLLISHHRVDLYCTLHWTSASCVSCVKDTCFSSAHHFLHFRCLRIFQKRSRTWRNTAQLPCTSRFLCWRATVLTRTPSPKFPFRTRWALCYSSQHL